MAMQFEKMTRPTFIRQKYFWIFVAHRLQIVSKRVIKFTKKYLFGLLIQLQIEKMLKSSFTNLIVECRLLKICWRNIYDGLLIWTVQFLAFSLISAANFQSLKILKLRDTLRICCRFKTVIC